MAIKTKNSRDTYRSNVKTLPMRQNGLEAQYQGIDVTEVNIDHSGLPMLARGGFGSLRNFTKVNKEYIVDVDVEEHFPRAAIIFDFPYKDGQKVFTPFANINQLNGNTLSITSSNNISRVFEFTTWGSSTNGVVIGQGPGVATVTLGDRPIANFYDKVVRITNTSGTLRRYILKNTAITNTGTTISLDPGSGAVDHVIVGIQGLTYSTAVNQLIAAIESTNGHNGSIFAEEQGTGILRLTQATGGSAGNVTIRAQATHLDSSNTWATDGIGSTSGFSGGGANTNYAIKIHNNKYSTNDLITETTGSITTVFGEEIFSFVTYLSGSRETMGDDLVSVTRDKIYLNMLSGAKGSAAISKTGTGFSNVTASMHDGAGNGPFAILDVTTDTFENQTENHKWRLNGFKHHVTNERMFYEDLRVDMLQSVTPLSAPFRSTLLTQMVHAN